MSNKQSRFEEELDRLIQKGDLLDSAIRYDVYGTEFKEMLFESNNKKAVHKYLKELPSFKKSYQGWYSEALALLKQLLPDRVQDFEFYYKYPRVRKDINFENYAIRDYLQGLVVTRAMGNKRKIIVDGSAAIPAFAQQLNMIVAAKEILPSTLMDLKMILQGDLFDSEIDGADVLAKAGFFRAGGAICGVVIEKHLKQVCENRGIANGKKKTTIFDLNQSLRDKDVVTVPQWRFVQHLADIRNICDHDKGREPTKDKIDDLLAGTKKILKSIF